MPRHITSTEARAALRTRVDLLEHGWHERDLARAVSTGELRRVQRGQYIDARLWADLWPESRHVVEVVAAALEMREGGAVMSYHSAGVLWGLPLYRFTPAAVHVTIPPGARSSSRQGLTRHRDALADDDVTVMDGIACTTLARTIFDAVRALPPAAAVAFADAGVRAGALVDRTLDVPASEALRGHLLDRVTGARGVRGRFQADRVIRFADGSSESPGESVSRLQLSRLGFREFIVQVPVLGPNHEDYRVDIGIEDVHTLFEFDGRTKYIDEAKRSGRTLQEVLLDEKTREDWIRGVTQRRLVRAGDGDIATPESLGSRLSAFGIPLPRRA